MYNYTYRKHQVDETAAERLRQKGKFTIKSGNGKIFFFELGKSGSIIFKFEGTYYNVLSPGQVLYAIADRIDFLILDAYDITNFKTKKFIITDMSVW